MSPGCTVATQEGLDQEGSVQSRYAGEKGKGQRKEGKGGRKGSGTRGQGPRIRAQATTALTRSSPRSLSPPTRFRGAGSSGERGPT
jgi:hypothetical protein